MEQITFEVKDKLDNIYKNTMDLKSFKEFVYLYNNKYTFQILTINNK